MKTWLRLGLVVALCVSGAAAVDWKSLKPQGYVSDFAGVVGPAEKTQLEAYCAAVERATGAQMALVTVPSLEGEPIEDVANTLFRAWGVGPKGTEEGILLLVAIQDRRDRVEVGYGLEPILPDGLDGSILRAMRPALRQGDYGDAMRAAAETIGGTIARAKNVSLNVHLPLRSRPATRDSIPWPMVLGGIFLILWLLRAGGPRGYGGGGLLPGLILGTMMGRSTWGSRGGGGFGGFDSGDSFGGFGGGDSGGGGASGDW
jgi:uncharacterized protein